MKVSKSDILQLLMNKKMSSVIFVQDYIQLQFDGSSLTAYVWPTVKSSKNVFERQTPGYRDALCNLIGKVVVQTSELANQALVIKFIDGTMLEISLNESHRTGPEAAMLQEQSGKRWNVW